MKREDLLLLWDNKGIKNEMTNHHGVVKGAVTLLELLADQDHRAHYFINQSFAKIEFHPMDNKATV